VIRAARERGGISQAALATKIGMHRENVIRVEKGRGTATIETLMRIAEGLGMDLRVTLMRRHGGGRGRPRKG
jgi:transcriptional regulator with XRE-family HTH domain